MTIHIIEVTITCTRAFRKTKSSDGVICERYKLGSLPNQRYLTEKRLIKFSTVSKTTVSKCNVHVYIVHFVRNFEFILPKNVKQVGVDLLNCLEWGGGKSVPFITVHDMMQVRTNIEGYSYSQDNRW